jgi:hypothetical protein
MPSFLNVLLAYHGTPLYETRDTLQELFNGPRFYQEAFCTCAHCPLYFIRIANAGVEEYWRRCAGTA